MAPLPTLEEEHQAVTTITGNGCIIPPAYLHWNQNKPVLIEHIDPAPHQELMLLAQHITDVPTTHNPHRQHSAQRFTGAIPSTSVYKEYQHA